MKFRWSLLHAYIVLWTMLILTNTCDAGEHVCVCVLASCLARTNLRQGAAYVEQVHKFRSTPEYSEQLPPHRVYSAAEAYSGCLVAARMCRARNSSRKGGQGWRGATLPANPKPPNPNSSFCLLSWTASRSCASLRLAGSKTQGI